MRSLLSILSPAGEHGRLSILILHRVLPVADVLFPEEMDAQRFDEVCRWVKSWFTVLPLDEAVRRLASASLPARALAITFDDGYADNHDVALPILLRHGLQATVFVATGFLDGGRMWNDTIVESIRRTGLPALDLRDVPTAGLGLHTLTSLSEKRSAIDAIIRQTMYLPMDVRGALVHEIAERAGAKLPTNLMMTSAQVVEMRGAGMLVGAHTVSHPILANLDRAAARAEMADSKRFLEDLLGERVGLFAYPSGKPGQDFTGESVAIARDVGFDAAVSTAWGTAGRNDDRFQLPRFTPWDRSRLRFGTRMLHNLWTSRRGNLALVNKFE